MTYMQQHECFLTAAECLSFTAAAEKLYMSQSALSRNVAALEESLGVKLFNRENNVLSLTPGGEIIYQWMKKDKLVREMTVQAALQANAAPRRRLRIGTVKTEYPSERMARSFSAYFEQHPNVELSLHEHHAKTNIRLLQDGELDVAFLMDVHGHALDGLHTVENKHYERVVLLPFSHPLAGRGEASLADFRGDTFISLQKDVSPTMTANLHRICAGCGFQPEIEEAKSSRELLEQVVAGHGVALVPENHRCASDPLYRTVRLREKPLVGSICVWNPDNPNPCLIEFLDVFRATRGYRSEKEE